MPRVGSQFYQKSDDSGSDIESWEVEKTSRPVVTGDLNDVSRWIRMINESRNVNVAFLHILKEIEDNTIKRIDILQKDLESKIKMRFRTMNDDVKSKQKGLSNADAKELLRELGVTFPLQDYKSFEAFDNMLEDDTDKEDALRELLFYKIDGTSSVTRDIYKLMNYIFIESVQIKYTWLGRKFKGQQKKNFSLTNVYLCMEDALMRKHKESREALKLNSKFANYFCRVNFKNKPNNQDSTLE